MIFHCLGHWRIAPSFHDVAFLDSICLPACQLLQGRPVRFWHDQAFVKPAGDGAVVQWHQDYSYWDRTGPRAHLTVHIALDDQTDENGALHYVPGSHRWTRDGGRPLPQAAAKAREKMARARDLARSGQADAEEIIAGASFDTDMDALYNDVLTDDERASGPRARPSPPVSRRGTRRSTMPCACMAPGATRRAIRAGRSCSTTLRTARAHTWRAHSSRESPPCARARCSADSSTQSSSTRAAWTCRHCPWRAADKKSR